MESPEIGMSAGIVMEFPANDDVASSPSRIPRRLRRRLLETKSSSPSSVEEIEAKLRDADLRRNNYYKELSSKARLKPRSPSKSFFSEDDPSQRLEAKLQAAEQKRLSILANARMRLTKMDELRQAARTGVELRCEKERAELVTKVESRVQQAEANRLLLLKADRQKRATLNERTSRSLLQRITHENRYKECVHAAILHKRASAETKRLRLLDAEKKRAVIRMQKVQKATKSVLQHHEAVRRSMKDSLDNRLQKAKRQRAEFLRQRRVRHDSSVNLQWNKMHEQADYLPKQLALCWRRFLKTNKTTFNLVKAYEALNIKEKTVKNIPFEKFAYLIDTPTTLQTVRSLLERLEIRYKISKSLATTSPSRWNDIQYLLKGVVSPKERNKFESTKEIGKASVALSRYQVRIVLCAYMILCHPGAVFSDKGEREIALANAAETFVKEFDFLIQIMLGGPIVNSDEGYDPVLSKRLTFRSQLAAFDAAWCSYLKSFVVWKIKDVKLLEENLVKAACQLELSKIRTRKLVGNEEAGELTPDIKAIQNQANEDQKLLKQNLHYLCGDAGIERMESALSNTRMEYFNAKQNGSHAVSPIKKKLSSNIPCSSSSSLHSSPNPDKEVNLGKGGDQTPSCAVHSLFKDDSTSHSKEGLFIPHSSLNKQSHGELAMENEMIVNEMIHEQGSVFADELHHPDEDRNQLKDLIKETMEKAFWDCVLESMKEEKANNNRVVQLLREVRDEICGMAPRSWKEEICEAIDVDVFSQVLDSGELDMDYLGRILEYALTVLRKLSAPADEDNLKTEHQKLLTELAEICQIGDRTNNYIIALVKGLRFVLQQIQALKQEISKARIRLMEPVLKGPAGLEYLKKAFGNRYGPPSDALTNLPLTLEWISSVWNTKDEEWAEHTNCVLGLAQYRSTDFPSVTLRTGGNNLATPILSTSATDTDDKVAECCTGEKIDLSVRLGLLKLVSGVTSLTEESLPETMKLNLLRLRKVQARFQTIVVTSTSMLVMRQIMHGNGITTSNKEIDMDKLLLSCVKELIKLLKKVSNTGIKEIVEILFKYVETSCNDDNGRSSIKNVMTSMLKKSLQSGDPVFNRVLRAVYLAARGGAFVGGSNGRELAAMAMKPIGAVFMVCEVMAMAKGISVMARVSRNLHSSWYVEMTKNMSNN
ncbi:uncharacterized protein LOC124919019 isoform X2 [Impatiens glandulifera]|uniref:uncharacterized protein LOC124919019 isoform X2 n=1 Tax=Impatiens glandulifera TaxID=253017 RepID=UPI001FB0F88D|nr:uncharacterized protein LOC124919019 isoform X2 [Impatiens glandulifera]